MRSATEVVTDHLKALNAHDLDAIAADYTDDAVLIFPGGVVSGLPAVRAAFGQGIERMPDAVYTTKSMTEANGVVLLEWTLEAAAATADDGIDTIVVRDGMIVGQTARFTPKPR
ncbi:MAG: hypothetical protein JWN95_1071 [Frankiales bacterium]|nr:hypothetical protein [Frankiales bacterium]